MESLEVSGAVRPIYESLGVKRLMSADILVRVGGSRQQNRAASWKFQPFVSLQLPTSGSLEGLRPSVT